MRNLTLGSLFDGSGGFPLGGLLSGITPLWASEIEPFPIIVTKHRLPFVEHLGDISKINGNEIEPVDIITFGSPCQDMSIAGKRSGLDGSRSCLFHEAIRIVKEMREATNGEEPRYIVWENVAGAFSSNKGEDFRCVLEEICHIKDDSVSVPKADKWQHAGEIVGDSFSVCWRTLDAQHWGVPQRRKRIYLVADFASQCASKVLFESEGMSRYSAESFRAWQDSTRCFAECVNQAGIGIDGYNSAVTEDTASTLGVNCGMSTGRNGVMVLNDQGGNRMDVTEERTSTLRAEAHHPPIVLENHPGDSRIKIEKDGVVQTLASRMGTGGNNLPLVMHTKNFDVRFTSLGTKNIRANVYETEISRCLDTGGQNPDSNHGGVAVVAIEGNGARPSHHGDGYKESDVMYTLNTLEQHGVAYGLDRASFNQGKNAKFDFAIEEEVEPTIVSRGPGAVAYSSSKASFFTDAEEEMANTLVATDYKDPPIVNDMDCPSSYGFYPQLKAECMMLTEEKSGCLVNGTNPGYQNGVLENEYIVRRLTPIECARLQGFPDWWCSGLGTEEPTDDEIEEWRNIFIDFAKACGKEPKPKSDAVIRKWLKDPYSDSAAYKLWGNGVALPNVYFVLSGIAFLNEVHST